MHLRTRIPLASLTALMILAGSAAAQNRSPATPSHWAGVDPVNMVAYSCHVRADAPVPEHAALLRGTGHLSCVERISDYCPSAEPYCRHVPRALADAVCDATLCGIPDALLEVCLLHVGFLGLDPGRIPGTEGACISERGVTSRTAEIDCERLNDKEIQRLAGSVWVTFVEGRFDGRAIQNYSTPTVFSCPQLD